MKSALFKFPEDNAEVLNFETLRDIRTEGNSQSQKGRVIRRTSEPARYSGRLWGYKSCQMADMYFHHWAARITECAEIIVRVT